MSDVQMNTPVEKKAKLITFQIFRNMSPLKKLRAKSLEEAKGEVKKMAKVDPESYFELKGADGKLVPVLNIQ